MNKKSTTIGLIAIWGWCFFSALSRVLTSHVTQQIDPAVICFYTFIFSSLLFNVLNSRNSRNTMSKLKDDDNRKNIILLNITTFGAWFFLIYPLKYIEPAMVSTITLGISPFATLVFAYFIYQKMELNIFDIVISLMMLAIVFYIIYLCYSGVTMIGKVPLMNLVYAIVSCLIVGFATTASNIFAKKLSNNQFKPIEVLASRFFLTVILSGIITVSMGKSLLVSYVDIENIAMLSVILVIFPLYLGQVGIKELEPITVAITAPLMPVLVLVFELIDHQHFSILAIISTIMICVLVILSVSVHYQKNKMRHENLNATNQLKQA